MAVMRKPLSVACNGAMGFSSIFDIRQYRTFTGKKLICSSPSETSHNHDRSVIDTNLKCYYDQKITFIFSSDFETMFIKHSPSEIISLNFEKKTVNLNCNFPF